MTKKELKQEAVEYAEKINLQNVNISGVVQAYLAGSEPREKQIQIDAEQIRALQKQNGELTDELKTLRQSIKDYGAGCYENGLRNGKRKLEEQIEKMKCLNEEIIKALNECLDYEWLHAHNGKAKYLYLQTVIDIVNEKFKEIKEND